MLSLNTIPKNCHKRLRNTAWLDMNNYLKKQFLFREGLKIQAQQTERVFV